MESISLEAKYVLKFINQTQQSFFLTGKAGTGKTTLLRKIIETTHKKVVVVAPTGIAALNAGGVTIHSMFQLPFSGFIPTNEQPSVFSQTVKFETKLSLHRHFKMNAIKRSVIKTMELLIIDEVSMLRSDLLDAIEFMLQTVRKNHHSFGGVQVLFIGDLQQLPPVVKQEEWDVLRKYYLGKFFFQSHAIQRNPLVYIELTKIYRQTDSHFIEILNSLRNNVLHNSQLEFLNQYVQPDFDSKKNEGYIVLTTHNAKADAINAASLKEIPTTLYSYSAEVIGDFPEKLYPIEVELQLKKGAQVMFVKNDLSLEKLYFNGKIGVINSISEYEILVHFPEEKKTITVEKYEWKNIRYTVDETTKEILEETLGTFVQYPIKLAWAITVHKSQGLTFDKAALDVSHVFLPGQAYVAFSRLRSLNGLILLSKLALDGIPSDRDVLTYAEQKSTTDVLEKSLHNATQNFIQEYLIQTFQWGELQQDWRNHCFTYALQTSKSKKATYADWAKLQSGSISDLQDAAAKFSRQLQQLFSEETVNFTFVKERCNAAFEYFIPKLDVIYESLLLQMEIVKRIKKAQGYYTELTELEELQLEVNLRILKAQKLLDVYFSGMEINKENLQSTAIKEYKRRLSAKVNETFDANDEVLIKDMKLKKDYSKNSKKKEKPPKISTIEETLILWHQNTSIEDIALIRKLSVGTISTHLAKLIEAGFVLIDEVLPHDKINQLARVFHEAPTSPLSEIKEKVGDEFTWDELKWFQSHLRYEKQGG
jgi:hypothetical protein